MGIEWKQIEDLFVTESTRVLRDHAAAHPGEAVYGAMFDIETFDGPSLSIHLNTPEHLASEAGDNATKPHYRWLAGGFKYSLRVTKSVPAWKDLASTLEEATEADMDDDRTDADGMWRTAGELVACVCRAVIRLEAANAFAPLARTPDFDVAVTPDPREPGDLSLERMQKFRRRHVAIAAPSQSGR
jgi:hypothetical protein